MIGVVLLTHASLGEAFLEAAQQVVGPQSKVECFSIPNQEEIESRRDELLQAISRVNSGEGVIIVTDMFGGLSSHLAMSVLSMPRIEVISGMNLPMLIKLLSKRAELPLAECAYAAQEAGRKYISLATHILEPQKKVG
jgi:PTS system mannose-specific IIA component